MTSHISNLIYSSFRAIYVRARANPILSGITMVAVTCLFKFDSCKSACGSLIGRVFYQKTPIKNDILDEKIREKANADWDKIKKILMVPHLEAKEAAASQDHITTLIEDLSNVLGTLYVGTIHDGASKPQDVERDAAMLSVAIIFAILDGDTRILPAKSEQEALCCLNSLKSIIDKRFKEEEISDEQKRLILTIAVNSDLMKLQENSRLVTDKGSIATHDIHFKEMLKLVLKNYGKEKTTQVKAILEKFPLVALLDNRSLNFIISMESLSHSLAQFNQGEIPVQGIQSFKDPLSVVLNLVDVAGNAPMRKPQETDEALKSRLNLNGAPLLFMLKNVFLGLLEAKSYSTLLAQRGQKIFKFKKANLTLATRLASVLRLHQKDSKDPNAALDIAKIKEVEKSVNELYKIYGEKLDKIFSIFFMYLPDTLIALTQEEGGLKNIFPFVKILETLYDKALSQKMDPEFLFLNGLNLNPLKEFLIKNKTALKDPALLLTLEIDNKTGVVRVASGYVTKPS